MIRDRPGLDKQSVLVLSDMMTSVIWVARAKVLAGSCHPAPCITVTAIAMGLALGTGVGWTSATLLGVVVLVGQLCIGWTNDAHDVALDLAAGRRDKPLMREPAQALVVARAAWVAGVLSVPLSFSLGVAAGAVHLIAVVGSGLSYDLWLKPTAWSWLPFVVAFGALPAVVTLASPSPYLPPAWAMASGALLGVTAHLMNALPDLATDSEHGIRGAPHRLGARGARSLAAGLMVATAFALTFGPSSTTDASMGAGAALVITANLVGAAAVLFIRWPASSRKPFLVIAALAVTNVVVLVWQGTSLA